MEQKEKAIAHFEGLIRDTDQVLPHCSEALRAELLEQRGYYELALEALRPVLSDEPLTRELHCSGCALVRLLNLGL